MIWREAVLARKAKPLVVSMGDLAASGGYYLLHRRHHRRASQHTYRLHRRIRTAVQTPERGRTNSASPSTPYAQAALPISAASRPLTAEERAIYQEEVEQIYNVFIGHVAEGRNMTTAAVDSIGQGRIWSGTDAKQIRLVDVIGGLETAKSIAAKMAGLDNYRTVNYPEQKEFLQKLMEDFSADAKAYFAKEELGESYRYYAKARSPQQPGHSGTPAVRTLHLLNRRMTNKEIARAFKLAGQLLELHDENPFKVRSFQNAAFKVNDCRKRSKPWTQPPSPGSKGSGRACKRASWN